MSPLAGRSFDIVMLRLVVLVCFLALSSFGLAGPALAHAALIGTVPSDGAVLEAAPSTVQLRFNEPVSPLLVHVIDAAGRAHNGLAVTARDEIIEVALPTNLPRGTQVLSYRVVSTDGHPIGGSVVFSIGQPGGISVAEAAQQDMRVPPLIWLARITLYVGLFVGAGGAFFQAWIAPDAQRRLPILHVALGLGLVAALVSVGLQGIDALGVPLTALSSLTVWTAGFNTSLGLAMGVAVVALLASWLSLTQSDRPRQRGLAGLALLGVGAAFALTGHASAASPQWLMRPAVFLHVVGVTYWIGALVPLLAVLGRHRGTALLIVRRFSTIAVFVVAVLTLTGIVLAVVQVKSLSALTGTAYGNVLLAKFVAVSGLLALATLNRFRLTPGLSNPKVGTRRLAQSVSVEIALAAVIFMLAATWRFTPPPRALAQVPSAPTPGSVAAPPAVALLHGDKAMTQVTLTPGQVGLVRATIVVMGADHGPLEAKEVVLSLALPTRGIEPIERRAVKTSNGVWQIDNLSVPLAGRWQVRVDVLISDFEKVVIENAIEIGAPTSPAPIRPGDQPHHGHGTLAPG